MPLQTKLCNHVSPRLQQNWMQMPPNCMNCGTPWPLPCILQNGNQFDPSQSVWVLLMHVSECKSRLVMQGAMYAALCLPMDRSYPQLRISSRRLPDLIGQRFVVRVDDWPATSTFPNAHLVRILGPLSDLRCSIYCPSACCLSTALWHQVLLRAPSLCLAD